VSSPRKFNEQKSQAQTDTLNLHSNFSQCLARNKIAFKDGQLESSFQKYLYSNHSVEVSLDIERIFEYIDSEREFDLADILQHFDSLRNFWGEQEQPLNNKIIHSGYNLVLSISEMNVVMSHMLASQLRLDNIAKTTNFNTNFELLDINVEGIVQSELKKYEERFQKIIFNKEYKKLNLDLSASVSTFNEEVDKYTKIVKAFNSTNFQNPELVASPGKNLKLNRLLKLELDYAEAEAHLSEYNLLKIKLLKARSDIESLIDTSLTAFFKQKHRESVDFEIKPDYLQYPPIKQLNEKLQYLNSIIPKAQFLNKYIAEIKLSLEFLERQYKFSKDFPDERGVKGCIDKYRIDNIPWMKLPGDLREKALEELTAYFQDSADGILKFINKYKKTLKLQDRINVKEKETLKNKLDCSLNLAITEIKSKLNSFVSDASQVDARKSKLISIKEDADAFLKNPLKEVPNIPLKDLSSQRQLIDVEWEKFENDKQSCEVVRIYKDSLRLGSEVYVKKEADLLVSILEKKHKIIKQKNQAKRERVKLEIQRQKIADEEARRQKRLKQEVEFKKHQESEKLIKESVPDITIEPKKTNKNNYKKTIGTGFAIVAACLLIGFLIDKLIIASAIAGGFALSFSAVVFCKSRYFGCCKPKENKSSDLQYQPTIGSKKLHELSKKGLRSQKENKSSNQSLEIVEIMPSNPAKEEQLLNIEQPASLRVC